MIKRSSARSLALFAALSVMLGLSSAARAELDKESQEALEKTQQLLRDQAQRANALKESKDAQRNHQSMESMLGASNTNSAYEISAEVLEKIVKDTNGDIVLMQQIVEEAQKNPEAFAKKYFNESQRARIKQMAEKAPGSSGGGTRKP